MIPRGLAVTATEWEIVRRILDECLPGIEVWAFGSRVDEEGSTGGRLKPMSDLDLVVMTERALPFALYADLKDAFTESDLPWKVDVVEWATTSAEFRNIIERNKVTVKEAAPC